MRILHLSDVCFPRVNGVSTSIQTFRRELARLGHETVLVAPAYPAPHEDDARTVRVASRAVPLDPEDRAMRWRALSRLDRLLAEERFDLVHVQTPFLAHYAAIRLARRRAIPVIATYHTLFEEYLFHYVPLVPRGVMRALARRISRGQCDALDAVIVPSTAMRETLERYGVRTRIEIVPTGIPLAELSGGDGMRFRAARGIAPSRPVLLYVGRVAFEKNIGFLLRVLPLVRRDIPDALLVVCGEGPALAKLTRLARALGVAEAVRFVGYLERTTHLLDCYRAADAFVFASRTETQGLVLLEAMALGVPVVSTAVMGTRDIVGPERGALVAADDEDDFAAKVVRLLRDRDLRARLSAEGREFARSWSATSLALRMEAFYRSVLDQAAASRLTSPQPA
ncbi:MAG TPA: glycosyltransferase [Burkholderiales bacterium]|nr:glycosyltransferase [Burkholderiales bacterium]